MGGAPAGGIPDLARVPIYWKTERPAVTGLRASQRVVQICDWSPVTTVVREEDPNPEQRGAQKGIDQKIGHPPQVFDH
jgi:hypothetical protein